MEAFVNAAADSPPLRPRLTARRGIGRPSVGKLAIFVIFAALAASCIYPLLFVASTALRTNADYRASPGGLPSSFTSENFERAFSQLHIGRLALNSLMVVVPAVILIAILACCAAYALVHLEIRLSRLLLAAVICMMALPPTVLLIPIFKLVLDVGLLNNRLGLILVYTALNLPFSIYLLTAFMRSVPVELLRAAGIDGAGPVRTLWSVVLPLIRPGLMTLVTLNFLFLWNELIFSLVILQQGMGRTIMVGIAQFQAQPEKNYGVVAAGLLLSMIPPLLIFVFFQRDLARGLTAGATK
ncbi:MAG: carbohydrate ABC transporter permease [Actinobacteria bacterium]|nr:carbohydrate ABC transporter permease [Actinomycetota bacterium]